LPRNKRDEPIYSPHPHAKERGIIDLIQLEWEIIDELQKKAKECVYDKHEARYLLTFEHLESGHDSQLFVLASANRAYFSGPKPTPILARAF